MRLESLGPSALGQLTCAPRPSAKDEAEDEEKETKAEDEAEAVGEE